MSQQSFENKLIKTFDQLLITQNTNEPLNLIKNWLIGASLGGPDEETGKLFIKLQHRIELNASLALLRFINQIAELPHIAHAIQQHHPTNRETTDLTPSIKLLETLFILLQGLMHLHPASQNLFRSEYNLRILLTFLPPALHSPAFSSIGIPLLDLILITFVDSPANAQLFESAGGLEILVQAMKQKALKTELRVKVLETLWAWWTDDEDPASDQHHPILSPITRPHQSDSNLPSALLGQDSSSACQKTNHHPTRPKSSAGKVQNTDNTTTSIHHQPRGNSRIRPISLPPPTLPEEEEEEEEEEEKEHQANISANLSDGHETPRPNKPGARVRIQPSTAVRTNSRSQSSLTHGAPSSSPMVKASSEGSNGTPSRPSTKPSDPASRLRLMLENTAGEFVPATPRHPHRTRPTTTTTTSSSPTRTLHPSQPVSLVRRKAGQSDSDDNASHPGRPSDESEDSDRMDRPPLAVRQRRTAIKLGNNTPQRMIRHKQSASLGSIQSQLQRDPTASPSSRSRESSSDGSGVQGPGSDGSSERGEGHRARDPTRRTIRSSVAPHSPPRTLAETQRGASSKLSDPSAMESSAEPATPRLSADTPRASRAGKTTTPLRASGPSSFSKASSGSSGMTKSSSCSSQDEQYVTTKRHSTPLKATKTTTNKTLITPAAAAGTGVTTPMRHSSSKMGLLTPLLSPNQRFISRPHSSLINHSDLELIVNGTDSDVGPAAARVLSAKKDRTGGRRRGTIKKAAGSGSLEEGEGGETERRHLAHAPVAVEGAGEALGQGAKQRKTGILEKYMANSDDLVRSFREIGVGFKALSRLPHSPSSSSSSPPPPPLKPLHRSNR